MATDARSPRALLPPARRSPARFLRARRLALATLAVAVCGGTAALLWSRRHHAVENALERMSPDARRALFAETRREAEILCANAQTQPALSDRCVDAARFLLSFPECDASCAAFARARTREHQRAPTR